MDIPSEISQLALFDWYWTLKLSQVRHKRVVEQWLSDLAMLSVESGERQVAVSRLPIHASPSIAIEETYQDLMRSGLLRVTSDASGSQKASFGLEKLRSYVYTLKVRAWPTLPTKQVALMMCGLLNNPLGVETVEFYVRTIERGETHLLTDMALHDIRKFVRLIELLPLKSSALDAHSGDEQQRALGAHVEQYVAAYSELSRHYFLNLCEKIEPFTKEQVGLVVSPSLSIHQLRTRTPAYPQPVVVVPQELATAFQNQQLPSDVYNNLRPGGRIHLDVGLSTLVDQLPQKMAWERILTQVAALFVNRCLDETASPDLLEERAWEILLRQPAGFWGEVPITGKYWQVLGFQSVQEAALATIDELRQRTRNQIQLYIDRYTSLIQHMPGREDPAALGWYGIHIQLLMRLYYSFRWLHTHKRHLQFPSVTLDQLFEYHPTGSLTSTVRIVEQLLPAIFRAYAALVRQNFPQLSDHLAFFKFLGAPMLVEITHQPSYPHFHNDFLRIAYVVLPSGNVPEQWMVYTCEEKDSVVHIPFIQKTLDGMRTRTSGSQGTTFGQVSISRRIGDVLIEDEHAFICFTRFPSHYPVLDQAYQLLGNEVAHLLNGDFKDWHDVAIGRIDNDQLDRWIIRSFNKSQI